MVGGGGGNGNCLAQRSGRVSVSGDGDVAGVVVSERRWGSGFVDDSEVSAGGVEKSNEGVSERSSAFLCVWRMVVGS